jgi:hypothetical protein
MEMSTRNYFSQFFGSKFASVRTGSVAHLPASFTVYWLSFIEQKPATASS